MFRAKRQRNRHTSRTLLFAPLEPRQLLAGDLVAHWVADDLQAALPDGGTIETAWVDRIQDHVATVSGTPVLELERIGGRPAINFDGADGTDRFFVDSQISPLSNADDFTTVVVFQTDSDSLVGDGTGTWFENTGLFDANQRGFGNDWGLSITSNGQLSTGMGGGFAVAPVTVYSSQTGLNDGAHHLAIVRREQGTLQLLIDDNPIDQRTDAPDTTRSNLDLSIGSLTDGSLPFSGQIAQVRIYNGALNDAELSELQDEIEGYYSNLPPEANPDEYNLDEDQQLFIVPAQNGVLANDADPDGDALTARLISDVRNGTLGLSADGSFIYTPSNDFNGADQFTYAAVDFRASEPVTVTLNVAPKYDPPVAVPDAYLIGPGDLLSFPGFIGLAANDENPDNADLTVELVDDVNGGSVVVQSDGGFSYDPGDFQGIARFSYRLSDGIGFSEPAEVTISVNTPPVAVPDVFTVIEDTPLVLGPTAGPLANDLDSQADNTLQIRLIEGTDIGELTVEADGSLTFVPPENFSGQTSFVYRAHDGFEVSEPVTSVLNIEAVNDVPLALPESYLALPDRQLNIPELSGVVANDFDIEGDALSASVVTAPVNGTLEFDATGAFRYQPNPGFVGEDSFDYVVDDGSDTSQPATVTLFVEAGPIRISEVMTQNTNGLATRLRDDPDGRFRGERSLYDWIELHNSLPTEINLAGLHLTDEFENSSKWAFPPGATIPANGRLVVFASGLDVRNTALDESERLHTNFSIGAGEYLALTSYDGSPIDAFSRIPEQFANVSFGIDDNGDPRYFAAPSPGAANGIGLLGQTAAAEIQLDAGYYTAAQQVAIDVPAATIVRYTTDGSEPTLDNGTVYAGPITIDRTSTIRAAAFRDQYLRSEIDTTTYLFLEDVIRQSPDGSTPAGWPERPVRGQVFDYGMDPEIVDHPVWGPQMIDALTQIPSVSLVTDIANLVDPDTGIYVRAQNRGRAWERDVSVELINPDGSTGFQIDGGLRIRGGFSRGAFNPKHSFRLFFRDAYDGRLEFPLFEGEGVNDFANVDLRTAQNYAWSNNTFNDETRNSFLRDVYSRDLQRDLGQHYTRSRYYHLYLNGQYWGLYQTEERPEASYAESYIGGDDDHYDVVKASGGTIEATDGELEPWRELWAITREGYDIESYFAVQGKNPDGTDNPDLEVHVLADQLIDFTINYTYTGNQDMPTSLGGGGANNYWAVRNPDSRDGWQFIAHDNEHNMLNVNEDQTGPTTTGRNFTTFNQHYLHQQMMEVPEYRLRFADRVQEFFFNDGPLTVENAQARMQTRIDQIDQAIIAESARWGDWHPRLLTESDWSAEVDWLMNTFLARRTEIVLNQYRRRDLFPDLSAASFNQHGGLVDPGFQLTMNAPSGTIYYTLGDQDPREVGGAISPNAIQWTGDAVSLTDDTTVTARVWDGTEWSPLTQARFDVGVATAPTALRVSEIHYHPSRPTAREVAAGYDDADDFEFVELVNPTDQPIDLSQVQFTRINQADGLEGIDFNFATSAIQRLAPGERVVIVEDDGAFRMRYGNELPVAGRWNGRLSNETELITLMNGNDLIQQFRYSDQWEPLSDGGGFSIEMVDVAAQDLSLWQRAEGWTFSAQPNGTPGDSMGVVGDVNGDRRFDSSDLSEIFAMGEYEDGISDNSTSIAEGDFNGDGEFDSSDLVFAFQLGLYLE